MGLFYDRCHKVILTNRWMDGWMDEWMDGIKSTLMALAAVVGEEKACCIIMFFL